MITSALSQNTSHKTTKYKYRSQNGARWCIRHMIGHILMSDGAELETG